MAKLKKTSVCAFDEHDRSISMRVDFDVNVNTDGEFTTTLIQSDVEIIESLGVTLQSNGRRGSRHGFFLDKTLDGLCIQIKKVLQKCLSRELISEETILRYSFCTVASFGFTKDGKIIPNLGWSLDGEIDRDKNWQHGTVMTHSANRHAVGVQLYIKPFVKKVFRFLDGKERTYYDELSPFGGSRVPKTQYYLRWLEGIASTRPPEHGSIIEIEYTEDRAKFFVELYKSICRLANTISKFQKPEDMIKLIETGKYLMQ